MATDTIKSQLLAIKVIIQLSGQGGAAVQEGSGKEIIDKGLVELVDGETGGFGGNKPLYRLTEAGERCIKKARWIMDRPELLPCQKSGHHRVTDIRRFDYEAEIELYKQGFRYRATCVLCKGSIIAKRVGEFNGHKAHI